MPKFGIQLLKAISNKFKSIIFSPTLCGKYKRRFIIVAKKEGTIYIFLMK